VRVTAAAACVATMLAACTGGGYSLPKAKPAPSLPGITAVQDLSNVVLAGVPGRTTTTAPRIGPGPANLKGTVSGPDGPVAGAVVHLERLVEGGTATADASTAADGTWVAANVIGGRYRVRAYLPPELALVKPAVFFLGGTENKILDITLTRYTGLVATASVAPTPPLVDEPANLVVRVAQQSVDAGGVVRSVGLSGAAVQLVGSGLWRVESPNPSVTNDSGDAEWQVRCRSAGSQQLAVLVNDTDTLALTIPPCQDVVAPPPPDQTTSTTFPFRRTTTTIRRSTTTTR
jgi:hypothetical protein